MENVAVTKKGLKGPVPCRLFFIMARRAPIAVILRRGPSRWVQLIKWNTQTDEFEMGQWFHGRIYERRSDLSPDGSLFIYFAQKITGRSLRDKEYTYAWTAISRPPYLTALALWPKGDCWHGGGLFENGRVVFLNHKPEAAIPHPKHRPHLLRVRSNPNAQGEDDPIFSMRLERDGWVKKQEWEVQYRGPNGLFETTSPGIFEKKNREGNQSIRLLRTIQVLDYSETFSIIFRQSSKEITIEQCGWADWDQSGRLVFARHGKLFAGWLNRSDLEFQLLRDFNREKPKSVSPPSWAKHW